ncbi:MAG: hypothetical protein WCP20_14300 [Desulfuromonadales bacterium]
MELNEGNVEGVIKAIEALVSSPGYNEELCEMEIGYFICSGSQVGGLTLGRRKS